MSGIQIISASAGTGKTYRLTEIILDALTRAKRRIQPERVMAITYTRKAAWELQSRIRRRLMETREPDLVRAASRFRDGYQGTIHAICQRLLWEFALDGGLSPSLELLPESERRLLFRQTLAELPLAPGMVKSAERMELQLDHEVIGLVDRARANRMNAEALNASGDRSLERMVALLPSPEGTPAKRDAALLAELQKVAPELEALSGDSKAAQERAEIAASLLAAARLRGTPAWSAQIKAYKKLDVANLHSRVGGLLQLLQDHSTHPSFRGDIEAVVRGAFDLAAAAQARFAERKNAARIIDYDDMLALALELLEREQVRAAVAERVELLLVDEFQDTSPMQLAVIQRVAELARETVWVGDRKQAIFGFQGSDPELMNAAVESALGGKAPEVQSESYRSRPGLVDFCSSVFAAALGPHGFPAAQVELTAARPEMPELKGTPFLETWRWPRSKGTNEANAVASGVQSLLADPPLVRKGQPGEEVVVRMGRGDVAVLCRSNVQCQSVAAALQARGIPAVVRLGGLSETVEAQICVAALRLLVDPGDGVAAAILSWLTGGAAADPDAWLSGQVEAYATKEEGERSLPFKTDPSVSAVRGEHERARVLSPSEAMDVCLVAVELPRLCMALPDSAQRLANLESLRASALAYEDLCRVRRTACTIAGLVAHLCSPANERNDAGDDVSDAQAAAPVADAVTVLTYHKAKGLEWPVVVLTTLDADPKVNVFDMEVRRPDTGFDGAAPLSGRWIRYWPWPYGAQSAGIALQDAAAGTEEGRQVLQRELSERARLQYVGFTRARDVLILVAAEHSKTGMQTAWLDELRDAEDRPVLQLPWTQSGPAKASVAGSQKKFVCVARTVDGAPPATGTRAESARRWFDRGRSIESHRPPEIIRPSDVVLPKAVAAAVSVSAARRVGARQPLQAPSELMGSVGDAIHRFLAADPGSSVAREQRVAIAMRILEAHGVAVAIAPASLIQASDALRADLEKQYPGARWLREWPVRWVLPTGEGVRVMIGEVDLVLELVDRLVVVDHKSFSGGAQERDRRAAEHAGQLAAYAAALENALGKKVAALLIHFAVRGEIVQVQVPPGAFDAWLNGEAEQVTASESA